ncbi:MAG: T9SS type A sorting domain-containing protein [Prolixibacteraceae bacterium]|jgi:hypothetical protein|nr:T9SS type A sorting domain-containing protein [Prolixibacteraceae bacterium]
MKWGEVLICSNVGDSIVRYQWYKGSNLIPNATQQYYATNKVQGLYSVLIVDYQGCVNASRSISPLGLKSLSIYPNPATNSFTLQINEPAGGEAIIRVINSSGLKVMEFQTANIDRDWLKVIPVNNLENGTYVVQVLLNQKELFSSKVLVIK